MRLSRTGGGSMVDERIRRTRAALAEAVLALASERDFAGVTVADITRRAGIGYATFFRHYPGKDELLADVADLLVAELMSVLLPALLAEDTAGAALTICRFIDARRPISRSLLAGGAEARVRGELLRRATAMSLALDIPQPPGLPVSLVVGHGVTAMAGLLAWWLDQGDDMPAETMAGIIDRLVLTPIRPRR
ncbi:MAG: TetR/AcrR family transcriptional regulator [Bauldia sp.]